MEAKFNVASASNLRGPIDQLYVPFQEAGFPEHLWPDEYGWMTWAAFPGQMVGRVAIRDALAGWVAELTNRNSPYTRAQKANLMREGHVLERCTWPVNSIPAIYVGSLQMIAQELVELKPRRNRDLPTPCNGGILYNNLGFTLVDKQKG